MDPIPIILVVALLIIVVIYYRILNAIRRDIKEEVKRLSRDEKQTERRLLK